MTKDNVTRRDFVKTSAAIAAGIPVASMSIKQANAADKDAVIDVTKTRSYNPDMNYRRLGKTDMMISVVSLGGHWKQIPYSYGSDDFYKNRAEVCDACMEHGINFVDACTFQEVAAYPKVLGSKRDNMYISYSYDRREVRFKNWCETADKLKEGFASGLKEVGLEYVDLWRIMFHEQTERRNTEQEIENAMEAISWAKKEGLARHIGLSSHDRQWITKIVEQYPQIEAVVTPYTAFSKKAPTGSMFDALAKNDVGFVGIKPFASGSVFKSRGKPDSDTKEEDDKRARMVLRYILNCKELTAAIPGLVTIDQVKNAAKAVTERREFDLAEQNEFDEMALAMKENLPSNYQWLKDWEWV